MRTLIPPKKQRTTEQKNPTRQLQAMERELVAEAHELEQNPRRKKRDVLAANKSGNTKEKVFRMEQPYKPGTTYDTEWSKQKKATFVVARR